MTYFQEENITISPIALQAIDYNFQEDEKIEVIFTLLVKENLPIDAWFVNEDHYFLLTNGAQFMFYIDGTEQEITYTKKIVTLTEHDDYKLVMTNYYNNQSVEVNVIYEIRTYYADSGETSSNDLSDFTYPLLIFIILAVLVVILFVKNRSYEQAGHRTSNKKPSKKPKSQKSKKASPKKSKVRKVKKAKLKVNEEPSSKEPEAVESEGEELEIKEEVSPSFCGYCGKPVSTPFCPYCGLQV